MIWASCPATLSYCFRRRPADLFKDPAFSIGMIGCRSWGTMNLTWAVEYAAQAGWARIIILKCLLPLTGLRATDSCIDCHVLGIIIFLGTLMFVALKFADVVPGF